VDRHQDEWKKGRKRKKGEGEGVEMRVGDKGLRSKIGLCHFYSIGFTAHLEAHGP
jgi:hypothetical protein